MDAPVKFTALTAENNLSETVLAGVAAPFAVLCGMHQPSPCKFLLHQKDDVLRDDCLMVSFHVVLRDGAVVLDPLLCQE